MGRDILKSSIENASFNIAFQILFRCITFVLNGFIIRQVGQDVLGIMNVRLLLLESTILFLSKEPLLKACLTNTKDHNWAQVINQIWLSVPISGIISIILVYVWTNLLSSTEDKYLNQYHVGCYAVAFSCVVNQMTQNLVLVAQSYCFVKLKVVLETIYIVSRTIIFVIFILKYPDYAINAFSIAQVSSALILCIMYYGFFHWYINNLNKIRKMQNRKLQGIFKDMQDFKFNSLLDFFPLCMENKDKALDKKLFVLTVSFVKQSLVKQVLTEGERYIMTISPILTFSLQSMYDIVSNLGSLAARFIFRPIEDSAYFYFTQMIKRDVPMQNQDQKSVTEAVFVLNGLCKVISAIGLIILMFGGSYSHVVLYLYGGKNLISSALPVELLKCHCMVILFLAVNGVTECYVFATMNNKQLDRYNYLMVLFSIGFLAISYILTMFIGPIGFLYSNCINMGARIIHSYYFINNKYKDTNQRPFENLIPSLNFGGMLILSAIIAHISEKYYLTDLSTKSVLVHITIGGLCLMLTVLVWSYENKELVKMGFNKYKRKLSLKTD